MAETRLGVFAKYWQPGEVKTRLAATIGEKPASQIYRAFVTALLDRLAQCGDRRVLVYWPPERRQAFAEFVGQRPFGLEPQSEGDLGLRMKRYFETALAAGDRRIVLIGSDSPTLPVDYVHQAFDRLEHQPVVLGPSEDGGYYLIGVAETVPPIFDDVAFSSETLWQETTARLDAAGVDYATLPTWYDVDQATDLDRLRKELVTLAPKDSALLELRRALERMMTCE